MKNLQNIPQFPDFMPISLRYKNFLHKKLWNYQPQASEYNFTNLFIWREYFKLKFSVLDKWLIILSDQKSNQPYCFQPIGPDNRTEVVHRILSWLHNTYPMVKPIIKRADRRLVGEIKKDKNLKYKADRDYFDYIYQAQDLISLKGQKYHSKRNHINQLYKNHKYEYKVIDTNNINDCIRIEKHWCEQKSNLHTKQIQAECRAIQKLLNSYNSLNIQGGIIYVDGKPKAFAIGELLNKNMAVIHIEKADATIQGLYQLINQKFCEKNYKNISFVNREQDLGLNGLRKAKKSYYPIFFEEKYIISRIDESL
ncbi:MAG: phosphatidylglycerol lysyltransferase domain-containing protein [bacterium]